ncbi:MAG: cell division protein FtsX [Flavobacteriales bacterium]|nr:cell division protein FtsX [Flavobacteriales bacterium]MBO73091.1 cell division protein FtsX [Flavobacteriales bacterium]|tara:strand:- start:973 stop:1860 length:888 start_codon:yes stop_codon:yes gene_type:complete
MSASEGKYSNWRTTASYVSTAISIAMVIYVVGLLGLVLMKGKILGDSFKEKFAFEIYLKEGVEDIEVMQLKKKLDAEDFVKQTIWKDKEEALAEYLSEVDPKENFSMTLGANPLPQNIDVYFTAAFNHPDSINQLKTQLQKNPIVDDLRYPRDLLYVVHENINKISLGLLIVSCLLLIIAIGLITNTIRLRVYSQRFILKTMQLVGASNWFIKRPFIWHGMVLGFFSGVIAVFALAGTLKIIYDFWPAFQEELQDVAMDLFLYGVMLIVAICISWFATQVAVGRYLRLKTEKLYY